MKKIFFVVVIGLVFLLSISFVSAKEDTHIEIEQISDYSVSIILKDSSNNPIPNKNIEVNITKPNGYVKILHDQKLKQNGVISYFLGSGGGEYIVSIYFKGDSNYNPCKFTKVIYIRGSGGSSPYDYYDSHNYGDNVYMDDYIYDNYWDEDIYDNPYNYDGEWY